MSNATIAPDTNATRRQRLADLTAGDQCGPYEVSSVPTGA